MIFSFDRRQPVLLFFAYLCVVHQSLAQDVSKTQNDAEEMATARAALKKEHGDQWASLIMVERFEYQSAEGNPEVAWEEQGWIGGDIEKLRYKTEGHYALEEEHFEEAELQVLYSRAISPFWDLQAGIRHDIKPDPSRSYAVIGLQGLAPYWFEIDSAVFLSSKGDLSLRLEAEYELRITQRLILQPRAELNAALSDDEDIGVGSGFSDIKTGLRLRYEITRQFAPYIGVSWSRSYGDTTEYRQEEGERNYLASFVAGIRFWF